MFHKTINTKVMKTKTTILAIAIFFFNALVINQTSAQRTISNSDGVFSIVKVLNTASNTITLVWNDKNFDEIEILTEGGEIYMPTIPILNTQQMHLNDLEDGVYYINFKHQGNLLKTELIRIMNHQAIPNSI